MTTSPSTRDIIPLPEALDDLPDPKPFYYVATRGGVMVHRRTMYGRILVPAKEIGHLPEAKSFFWYNIPRLPAELVGQVLGFFAAIFAKHGSESMVYLAYKPDPPTEYCDGLGKGGACDKSDQHKPHGGVADPSGDWQIIVPDQKADHVGVKADLDPALVPAGWRLAGTIHSHPDFSAFHSGTDHDDAADHDGLHITIGYVNRQNPEFAGMVAFGGVSWNLDPSDYVDGPITPQAFPEAWMDKVAAWGWRPSANRNQNQNQKDYLSDEDWDDYFSRRYGMPSITPTKHTPSSTVTKWDTGPGSVWGLVDRLIRDGKVQDDGLAEYDARYLESEIDVLADALSDLGVKLHWYVSPLPAATAKA